MPSKTEVPAAKIIHGDLLSLLKYADVPLFFEL
jgi:hypothetical protein